jgi:hypothetical protein
MQYSDPQIHLLWPEQVAECVRRVSACVRQHRRTHSLRCCGFEHASCTQVKASLSSLKPSHRKVSPEQRSKNGRWMRGRYVASREHDVHTVRVATTRYVPRRVLRTGILHAVAHHHGGRRQPPGHVLSLCQSGSLEFSSAKMRTQRRQVLGLCLLAASPLLRSAAAQFVPGKSSLDVKVILTGHRPPCI